MVFLGFAVGTWLAIRHGRRVGISSNTVMDLVVWILVSSLVGARLTYVFAHLEEFRGRWLDAISPIQSDGTIGIAGLVVLGGVALAVVATWYYTRRKKLSLPLVLDVFAPSLAFGLAIGRIGCYLNGCCFGHPSDLPWAVIFPETCYAGSVYSGQTIHPTQLYAVAYNLVIGLLLLARTPHKKFTGELFAWLLVLYGIARGINESFRYYSENMIPFHIGNFAVTGSMIISAVMLLAGAAWLIDGYRGVKADHAAR